MIFFASLIEIHAQLKLYSSKQKTYELNISNTIQSSDTPIFKKAFISTSKDIDAGKIESFKHCKSVHLDFYFHDSLGYFRNRFQGVYDSSDQCQISVAPLYENIGDPSASKDYKYTKIRKLELLEQRKILSEMVGGIVKFFENQSKRNISTIALSAHSQGGVMLSLFALSFPDGFISLKEKKIKILGYFAADSHYFENYDFFQVYFLKAFKALRLSGKDSEANRELVFKLTQYRYEHACQMVKFLNSSWKNETGCTAWSMTHVRRIFDQVNSIKNVDFVPKYYGTGVRNWWLHQAGLHEFASQHEFFAQSHEIRYYAFKGETREDYGSKEWRTRNEKKHQDFEGLHGKAYWLFHKDGVRFIKSSQQDRSILNYMLQCGLNVLCPFYQSPSIKSKALESPQLKILRPKLTKI